MTSLEIRDPSLPIDAIKPQVLAELRRGPVVITAPTGTGKSTQVPRWLLEEAQKTKKGFILVVQPRRVACRAVAERIAQLEGERLGEVVGYRVRDDDRSSDSTRLLCVTPGIVLSRPELLKEASLVVLDELHERRLDTDLILAMLTQSARAFVAMSATLDGESVARHVKGIHLSVTARTFPVDVSYAFSGSELPDAKGVERFVRRIVRDTAGAGDCLVFLPGKGEISRAEESLSGEDCEVLPLHGGLSLREQAKVLAVRSGARRRVILATNVAETSLTIPGITVVIDSGLVRRTSYHGGRSYLALAPVALDSADQRAGRAGRTAPGQCVRLWGRQTKLELRTPPEMHRESLVPLVMLCAELEQKPATLPFLDPPKEYALEDARERLLSLGAIGLSSSKAGLDVLTQLGRSLKGLPLDPWLSRILVEARASECLNDAIDLVAALEQSGASSIAELAPEDQVEEPGCDLSALIAGVRFGTGRKGSSWSEAMATARRLRRALGVQEPAAGERVDREGLLAAIVRADSQAAHVSRVRKKRTVFSNGGTELELGKQSRAARLQAGNEGRELGAQALVVLATRGVMQGGDKRLLITLASSVTLKWLARAGVGDERVKEASFAKKGPLKGRLVVEVERVFAGRVLDVQEREPEGLLAREAIVKLFLQGRLHRASFELAKQRVARLQLAAQLGRNPDYAFFAGCRAPDSVEHWLLAELETLGVEGASDLELLSKEDFVPADVPSELAPQLDDKFPHEVDIGDCLYAVEYDLAQRQVMLSVRRGGRKSPPPASYLPRFDGFKVFVEAGGSFHRVKR